MSRQKGGLEARLEIAPDDILSFFRKKGEELAAKTSGTEYTFIINPVTVCFGYLTMHEPYNSVRRDEMTELRETLVGAFRELAMRHSVSRGRMIGKGGGRKFQSLYVHELAVRLYEALERVAELHAEVAESAEIPKGMKKNILPPLGEIVAIANRMYHPLSRDGFVQSLLQGGELPPHNRLRLRYGGRGTALNHPQAV